MSGAGKIVDFFRNADWLTRERVVAYSWMALAAYVAAAAYLVLTSRGLLDAWGRPVGMDFLCFWSAGALALKGQAAAAYDVSVHVAQQVAVVRGATPAYYAPWLYPPIYLLPLAVFALLPYGWSLLVWLIATGGAYVLCVRRIVPHPRTLLVAVAWPGFFDNALHGQNGFLTAALLGGGLILLETRPVLAGMLLGGLSYKPQLALLVPVALLAGRHWRALAAMAATVMLLCVAVTLLLGPEAWTAFELSRKVTQGLMEGSHGVYYGKVGVFSAVRQMGGNVPLAWSVQIFSSIAAGVLVAWTWRSSAQTCFKGALVIAAIPLATPWLNIYDLVMLAIPAAYLIQEGMRGGFLPWERSAIAAAAIVPVASIAVAWAFGIQLVPLVSLALIAVILRRMRRPVLPDARPVRS